MVIKPRKLFDLEPLVSVLYIYRQQSVDLRYVNRDRPFRLSLCPLAPIGVVKREPTARPSTDSMDPIELSRCAVLAEQVDVVPQGRQRTAQARDVDVAPGPPKQVAVKY